MKYLKYIFLLLGLTIFVNCGSVKYVPVESVQQDSKFIKQVERDTVYERDSVLVYMKADTVYTTRVKWRVRTTMVHDTIFVSKRDSVTNVVEVEREFTRLERIKMSLGEITALFILVAAVIVALWFIRKLKAL